MARRKQEAEGHVNHERWLLTYADLITLLMVFFLVMYSMSRADTVKFNKLSESLKRAFRVEVLKGNDPTSLQGRDGATRATSVVQEALVQAPALVPDIRMVQTLDDLREVLVQIPRNQEGSELIQIGANRDGVVISVAGNALFDSGKADLRPRGLELLDALADRVRAMPNDLRIEGHTDNIAITTPLYPSNWELSSARATTVGRYLAEQGGIAPRRLIAAGYGEHRPVAPNDTREGRARNRRVDIVVLFPQVPISSVADGRPSPTTDVGDSASTGISHTSVAPAGGHP